MDKLISEQAAIDEIRKCRFVVDAIEKIRGLPSAQPDLDSAYTEGYTQAEAKYRALWDEMQANIKEKAFGKRKGLIHTADICPIDRNALLKRYDATHVGPPGKARDLILNAPTIEPERKTGKWIHDNTLKQFFCSECNDPSLTDDDRYLYSMDFPNYCPNCGARMVQEGEDNGQSD